MKKNVVLAVALFALIAVGVSAQAGTAGLKYDLTADKKGYSVSAGTTPMNDLVIPETYNNLPVTTIASSGFSGPKAITNIIISNSVTTIGSAAFQNNINIRNVTIGSGVKNIEQLAFAGCANISSVTFQGTITSANFSQIQPFEGDLRNKYLAAGGGIGTYTKSGSTWTKTTATTATSAQTNPESDFDVVVSKDGKSVSITGYKGSAKEVSIPQRIKNLPVTIIGESAFQGSTSLANVIIPASVTSIEDSAFQDCTSLTSVNIPNGVIGAQAFENCSKLVSVTIGNGVTSIEQKAFYGCVSLTNVTIPNSVKTIRMNAFQYCSGLTSVTFGGSIPSSSGFHANAFSKEIGDLRDKFYATDKNNGTAGTYTRPDAKSTTWTKK